MKLKLEELIAQNAIQHKALYEIAVSEFNASDWSGLHKTISRLKSAEVLERTLQGLLKLAQERIAAEDRPTPR